jgi:hypothetical protein
MRAVPVLPAKVGKAWPHIAAWVYAALARGNADLGPEDIRAHLDKGSMQLWLAWDTKPVGCCITELIESERGRTCNIVVVAGERFGTWAHLEADIAQWARDWNCVRLSLIGRRGWVRRLAGAGWTEAAVTLEKRIDGIEQPDAEDGHGTVGTDPGAADE